MSCAPFVSSPHDVVRKMLEVARATKDDVLVDLGCGDGRILSTAIKDFGVKAAFGYEIREDLFKTASGEVEKLNINLRGDLDQSQLDRAAIRRDAQRLSDARTRLFERELMMLVDMRTVLNDSQWDRMRSQLERFGTQQLRPRANGLRKNQR